MGRLWLQRCASALKQAQELPWSDSEWLRVFPSVPEKFGCHEVFLSDAHLISPLSNCLQRLSELKLAGRLSCRDGRIVWRQNDCGLCTISASACPTPKYIYAHYARPPKPRAHRTKQCLLVGMAVVQER